jgi:hypothetical protein
MGRSGSNKAIPSPSVLFLVFFSSQFLFLLFGVNYKMCFILGVVFTSFLSNVQHYSTTAQHYSTTLTQQGCIRQFYFKAYKSKIYKTYKKSWKNRFLKSRLLSIKTAPKKK